MNPKWMRTVVEGPPDIALGANTSTRRRVLVLYDPFSTFIGTVKEYLDAFRLYSRHDVLYAVGTSNACAEIRCDLNAFDVVALHYSVRLSYDWYISPRFAQALTDFRGLKLLFIQDEYDHTELARRWIERLGIRVVFTCVPEDQIELVYPSDRFPSTEFVPVLTGYVPLNLPHIESFAQPLTQREILIGYRGRKLPFWYGNLAAEKWQIGEAMKGLCRLHGIREDIAWEDADRVYGDDWYRFLGRCVATLGTESGANVFDDDGTIQEQVKAALDRDPNASYESIWAAYMADHEGRVRMNQISPKIFEAIALRTALVLFEGSYSGVLRPDEHYIPLRKDYSNAVDVFDRTRSSEYVRAITSRAYEDVIRSGRYTYQRFMRLIDSVIDRLSSVSKPCEHLLAMTGVAPWTSAYATRAERELIYSSGCAVSGPIMLPRLYQSGIPTSFVLPPPSKEHLLHTAVAAVDAWGPFGEASTIAEVWPLKLRSTLRFEPGHGIANAVRYDSDARLAMACEGQDVGHEFEILFRPELVLKLDLLWESARNRPQLLSLECSYRGVCVYKDGAIKVETGQSVIELPWRKVDRIRLRILQFAGEQRFMLRRVRVLAWRCATEPHKGISGAIRGAWQGLPPGFRNPLRRLARQARLILRW